jgi:hypothetical protein
MHIAGSPGFSPYLLSVTNCYSNLRDTCVEIFCAGGGSFVGESTSQPNHLDQDQSHVRLTDSDGDGVNNSCSLQNREEGF